MENNSMKPSNDVKLIMAIYALFLSCIATFIVRLILSTSIVNGIEAYYVIYVTGLILLSLSGIKINYPKDRPFSILYRAVIIINLIYLITAYPNATASTYSNHTLSQMILWAEPIIILLSIVGLIYKPTLGLIPICYAIIKRNILNAFLGFSIDSTDWNVLADVGLFLIIGYIVFILFLLHTKYTKKTLYLSKHQYIPLLVLFSLAIHFGNYFHSGLMKLMIGEHPLDWILNNKTTNLIIGFREIGTHVILVTDTLIKITYELLLPLNIPLNLIIVVAQLSCLCIAIHKLGTRLLILFYDLTHVMIFALTGIFFWKWILLNIAYYHALSHIDAKWFSKKIMLVLACIIIISPKFFSIAFLAWFDTKSLNLPVFYAIVENEERIRIPNAYFLDFALTLNQTFFAAPYNGHFNNVLINITTMSPESMRESNRCGETLSQEPSKTPLLNAYNIKTIQNHHNYVLSKLNDKGEFYYNAYPHHKHSNPLMFSNFAKLDIRTIQAYEFEVTSKCFDYADGKFISNNIKTTTQHIPLIEPK